MTDHRFPVRVGWSGSTAGGYRTYRRDHLGSTPTTPPLPLSADAAFRGDPARLNPEQLLVLAASSCQLLSFLAAAARAGVDVLGYEDDALGTLDVRAARFAGLVLRPVVTVAAGTDPTLVAALVEQAHEECFVANSLAVPVAVAPRVVTS